MIYEERGTATHADPQEDKLSPDQEKEDPSRRGRWCGGGGGEREI